LGIDKLRKMRLVFTQHRPEFLANLVDNIGVEPIDLILRRHFTSIFRIALATIITKDAISEKNT
jgi:hypothetical protein